MIFWFPRGLRAWRERSLRRQSIACEPLEGRVVLSYLVIPHGNTFAPVHVSDARANEPLFSNGLAVKKGANFYPLYNGPKRPDLNGIQATAQVSGKNLVLTGTVDAPIVSKPTSAALGSVYSFAIDRGGASKTGPFPGRPWIRFDAIVNVTITTKSINATVATTSKSTNQPGTTPTTLNASAVSIKGDVVKVTVPLSDLPSNGHADDQWNVNFFTRNPSQNNDFHSIASFTPEHTMFQVYVKRPSTS